MNPKVIVVSHSYASRLDMARSLGREGYEVTVIALTKHKTKGKNMAKPIDAYSKYVNRFFYCPQGEENMIHLLLDHCVDDTQKAIIIPDSDFSAAAIDKHQEELNAHFLFPHIHHTPGEVVKWMDKIRQKELAQQVGMHVAGANIIKIKNREYVIPDGITYPCFTKSLATIVGGKRFLQRCDDEKALRQILDEAARQIGDINILTEDFKPIDKEYALLGFSDGQQVIIPAVILIGKMSESHFGVARNGQVLPPNDFEPILEKFRQMLLHIGFVGLFDIDFYESGGAMYFSELNLRFGGSGSAVTQAGANLPAMMVASLCGEPINNSHKAISRPYSYTNERTCMDDWYKGHLSTSDYKTMLREADILFVKDNEDPAPQQVFRKEYRKRYFKRIVKTFFKFK